MSTLGPTELLIILGVVLLLFGSAKLPQLARSLGKSARILKAETKGLYENDGLHDSEDLYENEPARPGRPGGPDQPGRADRPALSSPAGSSSSPERAPAAPAADGHRPAPR